MTCGSVAILFLIQIFTLIVLKVYSCRLCWLICLADCRVYAVLCYAMPLSCAGIFFSVLHVCFVLKIFYIILCLSDSEEDNDNFVSVSF